MSSLEELTEMKVKMWIAKVHEELARAGVDSHIQIDLYDDATTATWVNCHVVPRLIALGFDAGVYNYRHDTADKDSACNCDYGCHCANYWHGRRLRVSM